VINSIRVRLTLWYLLVFGLLLIVFSAYIYSLITSGLSRQFDTALMRTAASTANYFTEFVERKNEIGGAVETVKELQFGELQTAILREGKVLAASTPQVTQAAASTNILAQIKPAGKPVYATESGTEARLVAMPFQVSQVQYAVVVLEPMRDLKAQFVRMREIFFLGLPAALLLTAVGGFMLARKTLQPVVDISNQAERIGAQNLDERLDVRNPRDELGRLALVINALLSRLEGSFTKIHEFIADASHELRTPVAIIHGEADVALSRERSVADYQASLRVIREQSSRMGRIVNDMLALTRADSNRPPRREELYLDELVEECCHAAQTLAAPAGVTLSVDTEEGIQLLGDAELLRRMTFNLLDNAIHYTPSGGSVAVRLLREDSWARLTVSDTGIGIPPESAPRVFDRFFRVENGRRSRAGGAGLGLSIVKLAAESHQGRVEMQSEVGKGSKFEVTLPLDPAA
jgi:heavy metal sensor kinase